MTREKQDKAQRKEPKVQGDSRYLTKMMKGQRKHIKD